jgi:hypothetical protein
LSELALRVASWVTGRASREPVPRDSVQEPLSGWRVWQVIESKDGPALASWWVSTLWPARRALEARCGVHGSRPAVHHVCGIHAFATRDEALAYAAGRRAGPMLFARTPARALGIAVGRVSGWGRAVCHTRGWRSQYAYPYDLYLISGDRALARMLADSYAVETAPFSLS